MDEGPDAAVFVDGGMTDEHLSHRNGSHGAGRVALQCSDAIDFVEFGQTLYQGLPIKKICCGIPLRLWIKDHSRLNSIT